MATTASPIHILLTGAGRGLGLGFTRHWLESGNRVIALARNPKESAEIGKLAGAFPDHLLVFSCDVTQDDSVQSAVRSVEGAVDRVDILINNAGTYGSRGGNLDSLSTEELHRSFEVNTVGPLRVTRAFLPLLRRSQNPKIIHISSLMGSIADNGSGSSWPYRLSKAALNMASRNLAVELRPEEILSAVLHPGWVRTDMGGAEAPLTISESIQSMARTIESFSMEHSGGFFDRDGKSLPW